MNNIRTADFDSVRIRQGANTKFFLAREIDGKLVSEEQFFSPVSRQIVSFNLGSTGETIQSEAILGLPWEAQGEIGQIGGAGAIVTEEYQNHMLDYIQAAINGDPATRSTDIANTVLYDADPGTITGGAFTFPAYTEDDSLDENKPKHADNPGRIKITTPGLTNTTLKLIGERRTGFRSNDIAYEEETLTRSSPTSEWPLTENYFFRVRKIEGLTGTITGGNLKLEAQPAQKHTLFEARPGVPEGLTIFAIVGGVPILAWSVKFNNTSWETTPTSNRITLDCLARTVYDEATVKSGAAAALIRNWPEEEMDSYFNTDPAAKQFIDNQFFTGQGGLLLLGEPGDEESAMEHVIFQSATVRMGQNLSPLEGASGSPTQLPATRGGGRPEIVADLGMYYTKPSAGKENAQNWKRKFRRKETLKFVLYQNYWAGDGKWTYRKITVEHGNFASMPQVGVENEGELPISLSIRGITTGTGAPMKIEVVDDYGWAGIHGAMKGFVNASDNAITSAAKPTTNTDLSIKAKVNFDIALAALPATAFSKNLADTKVTIGTPTAVSGKDNKEWEVPITLKGGSSPPLGADDTELTLTLKRNALPPGNHPKSMALELT